MVSFNIENLDSDANLPLLTSFIKFDVAIATFKILLEISLKRVSKWDGHGKGRWKVLGNVPTYT